MIKYNQCTLNIYIYIYEFVACQTCIPVLVNLSVLLAHSFDVDLLVKMLNTYIYIYMMVHKHIVHISCIIMLLELAFDFRHHCVPAGDYGDIIGKTSSVITMA